MVGQQRFALLLFAFSVSLVLLADGVDGSTVTRVKPKYGSKRGGTKFYLFGTFDNECLNANGYDVKLIRSDVQVTYPLFVDTAGSSAASISVTYRGLETMLPGDYSFSVTGCDGTKFQCVGRPCTVEIDDWATPNIDKLNATTGPPGMLLEICGMVRTNSSGSSNIEGDGNPVLRNATLSSDDTCELVDPATTEAYGLNVNEDDYGCFKCKMQGGYIGDLRVMYYVSIYGNSYTAPNLIKVSGSDNLYLIQTYAVIRNLSANTGSTEGGLYLRVDGDYLTGAGDTPPRIQIGDSPCAQLLFGSGSFLCVTPPEQPQRPAYPGNRGLNMEHWSGKSNGEIHNSKEAINFTTTPDSIIWTDDFQFEDDTEDNFIRRIKGFFVPPKTAGYTFYLRGNDKSYLWLSTSADPADAVLIASCEGGAKGYDTYPTQVSSEVTLEAGQSYYIAAVVGEYSKLARLRVAVRMNMSSHTDEETFQALQEKQTFQLRSAHEPEKQVVTVGSWSAGSATPEVQRVVVDPAQPFHLCFRGVCTTQLDLSIGTSATVIANQLNKLPSIKPSAVSVASSTAGTFDVTFPGDQGDVDDLEVRDPQGQSVQGATITETTSGVASYDKLYFKMEDVYSPPINYDASAAQIQSALQEMFSVRCHPALTNGNPLFSNDYESDPNAWAMDEPFCGRYSGKNVNNLVSSQNILLSPSNMFLCFAHRGVVAAGAVTLTIQYSFTSGRQLVTKSHAQTVGNIEWDERWRYDCHDVKAALPSIAEKLKSIAVSSTTSLEEVFFDQVTLETSSRAAGISGDVNLLRLLPPRSSQFMMANVEVSGSFSSFSVSMMPYNCEDNFPLLQIHGLPVSGKTLSVTQAQSASPRITGEFTVSLGESSVKVPVNATATKFRERLETLEGIGTVSVRRENLCHNYTWIVDWESAGNIPLLNVDYSGLLPANAADVTASEENGGTFFDPIPGDLLRTYHTEQQLQATINNVPVHCQGNCTYRSSSAQTPSITGTSPSLGSALADTNLTIDGTGFSTLAANNTVMIGGVACEVISAGSSQLVCRVGRGQAGTFNVSVTVKGKGLAKHVGGPHNFTYDMQVTGISPSSGSVGGCTLVTISGTGFSGASVDVGGQPCDVVTQKYAEIICRTPAAAAEGSAVVEVTQASGSSISPANFTYNASVTPVIYSADFTSTPSCVTGGVNLTINGTGFGSQASGAGALMIGSQEAIIITYNNTIITARLPPLPPGSHTIKLRVDPAGCADLVTHSISTYDCQYEVVSLHPDQGSIVGGTRVIVTGQGFTSGTVVSFNGTTCDINSRNTTHICCTMNPGTRTHVVRKEVEVIQGKPSIAWKPKTLTVRVGEKVRWEWQTDPTITIYKFRVEQTADVNAEAYDGTGFRSGSTSSGTGVYEFQFGKTGIYTYWSGYVDSLNQTIMRGSVHVVPPTSWSATLRVSDGSIEASYDTSSGVNVSSGCPTESCSENTTALHATCNTTKPTSDDDSTFHFAFWECSTAVVDSITPNDGTPDTEFVIQGRGFSDEACENEVMIGQYSCHVTFSNESVITCRLANGQEFPPGTRTPFSVNIANRGSALLKMREIDARTFKMCPRIDSISPTTGSLAGGTHLTINGAGFTDTSMVRLLGGGSCDITNLNYTRIVCETGPSQAATSAVMVEVNGCLSACSPTNCTFQFSSAETPTLDSVTPSSIQGDHATLTLAGTKFGTDPAAVDITVGGVGCLVDTITDTNIVCNITCVPAGQQPLVMRINPQGSPSTSITHVKSDYVVSHSSISAGSLKGGTEVTTTGSGFSDDISITSAGSGASWEVVSSTCTSITARSPPPASAQDHSVDVQIQNNPSRRRRATEVRHKRAVGSTDFPTFQFSYSQQATPVVESISPSSGIGGTNLTITGQRLGSPTSVTIDSVPCLLLDSNATTVLCMAGDHPAGDYVPEVITVLGRADNTQRFLYTLQVDSVAPTNGSFGGGQTLTVQGIGFSSSSTRITVCGKPCSPVTASANSAACPVPASDQDASDGDTTCNVEVYVNNVGVNASQSFVYVAASTPNITSVSPSRGGTGGGTMLTIQGTRFGDSESNNVVTIDGVACDIQSANATYIVCRTGQHSGTIETKVRLEVDDVGIALQDNAQFHYIDLWSSIFTWGGGPLPRAGDFVVISAGQTILLDMDTPVLAVLLINGGKLVFDKQDLQLNAEKILITANGSLEVGTEAEPFQHNAVIMLHGDLIDKELPIYGTKMIAVRNGTLDLHGIPIPTTWTRLNETAPANAACLTLQLPVTWQPGDEIVIATTGLRHSQGESEKRTIHNVSSDGHVVCLTQPLTHEHLGISRTVGGVTVELRAEVGVLTRNVKVKGYRPMQWADEIEACAAGFNTGEFVMQTCFQGRFGAETGSDQFGAHTIISPAEGDSNSARARLSYVEYNYVGQAFRLGRYPVHFHLLGNTSYENNYVRGCGFHETFNRAVNTHGTHHVLLEHNVAFNVMGGAFFLEDGIETGNIMQYNLAIFVKASTSLLNDDITPAAYWITNPNNTVRHNVAAGGTHFGIWYRMHENPDGPSYDPNVFPRLAPLGEFTNNTVHSQGWFGIWIFQDYYPNEQAVFEDLTAWHCEKGAEWVMAGSLKFNNFVMYDNEKAGIEMKSVVRTSHVFSDQGPMISNSKIIGKSDSSEACTHFGIILPFAQGLKVVDTVGINFADATCNFMRVTSIDGTCGNLCGGWEHRFSGMSFVNTPNKMSWRWTHEGVLNDTDGTLTETGNAAVVVAHNPTLDSSKCSQSAEFSKGKVNGYICPQTERFVRFAFNHIHPSSLNYKDVNFTNSHGTTLSPWAFKRLTHKEGWMVNLQCGKQYMQSFVNAQQLVNISYDGMMYGLEEDCKIIICQNMDQKPDRVVVLGTEVTLDSSHSQPLSFSTNTNGDISYNDADNILCYMVSGLPNQPAGSMREAGRSNQDLRFSAYQCFYAGCQAPADPNDLAPVDQRPSTAKMWSATTTWAGTIDENGVQYQVSSGAATGSGPLPSDGNVRIVDGDWVVADTTLPRFDKLELHGVLELEFAQMPNSNNYYDFVINAEIIYIRFPGRLIVGWPNNVFKGTAEIILRGSHATPVYVPDGSSPNVGSKAIAVFGGLDLHGDDKGVSWTQLSQTADAGANSLTLKDDVSQWEVGDEIVVTPTGYKPYETEIFKLTSVSGNTIGLNSTLAHKHLGVEGTINNIPYGIVAEVGRLTRNIKVRGEEYSGLITEAFGARILVSTQSTVDSQNNVNVYRGFARFTNVEFIHTGQEGYNEDYDPRFSLAYMSAQTVNDKKPSYVKKCAFHHGLATAIGVFATNSENPRLHALEIEDNVVHHTIGPGIRIAGTNHTLKRNLVTMTVWPGGYLNRAELANFDFTPGIMVSESIRLTMKDNIVAGSERVGYQISGQHCSSVAATTDTDIEPWSGNVARSMLTGVAMFVADCKARCARINGFMVAYAWDFGVYTMSACEIELSSYRSIDNTLGLMSIVVGPSAVDHICENRKILVNGSLFVGNSPDFDCSDSRRPDTTVSSYKISNQARSIGQSKDWSSSFGKVAGMMFGNFHEGDNEAPRKKWTNSMAYPAVCGHTEATGNTFAHFGTKCGSNKPSFAITDTFNNEDLLHPLIMSQTTTVSVDVGHHVYYGEPNLEAVNPADCVDLICDAQKNLLLKDTDNGFVGGTGSFGAIVPNSSWEWDGNPVVGLGDYRIPKTLLTALDGSRIPVNQIAPHKGISGVETGNCTYNSVMRAFTCHDIDYQFLIMESMDADFETRRLSPVALLGGGYLDLYNGPQDHGWCAGYTCQKRLSTFHAIVAMGLHYEVHFTSTSPQSLRLRIMNSKPTDVVRLAIHYQKPERLLVNSNGVYKRPTNARYDSKDRETTLNPTYTGEFYPSIADGESGDNFFEEGPKLLYVLLKGDAVIDIETSQFIMLTVGASQVPLPVPDFFGAQIVSNIASFLNIPQDKVRIANIVAESKKRRKRSTTGEVIFDIEIGDFMTNGTTNTTEMKVTPYSQLTNLTATLYNAVQLGTFGDAINLTVLNVSVKEPLPPSDDPVWQQVLNSTELTSPIQIPSRLEMVTELVPLHEGTGFTTQPVIRMLDSNGDVVQQLGTVALPWQVTATVRSGTGDARGTTINNVTVPYTGGSTTFTHLGVSHSGSDYVIDFVITYPPEASRYTISSATFSVAERPLKAAVSAQSSNTTSGQPGSFTVDIRDNVTDEVVTDIAWKGHTWQAQASIHMPTTFPATLSGTTQSKFNASDNGQTQMDDIILTTTSQCPVNAFVSFRVWSAPADFDLTAVSQAVIVYPSNYSMPSEDVNRSVSITWNGDYDNMAAGKETQVQGLVWNHIMTNCPRVILSDFNITSGSIITSFVMTGGAADVDSTLVSLWDSLKNGLTLTLGSESMTSSDVMYVDSVRYYGLDGPPSVETATGRPLPVWAIVLIVVIPVLLAILLVGLLTWKFKYHKEKMRVHHSNPDFQKYNQTLITGVPPMATQWDKGKDKKPYNGDIERKDSLVVTRVVHTPLSLEIKDDITNISRDSSAANLMVPSSGRQSRGSSISGSAGPNASDSTRSSTPASITMPNEPDETY